MGDGFSNVYLFLNTSDNAIPAFSSKTLLITKTNLTDTRRVTPVPIDWNNDGNKDIITGGMDGKFRININIGTESEHSFNKLTYLR